MYATIETYTEWVEGDERSKTNPGHGYPEHSVEHNEYIEFKSKDEFIAWVEKEEGRVYGKKSYRAVKCTPVSVTTKVVIDIE